MQKFTKIFAVLAQAEMNAELEKALRQVSQMLRLDYDKIRVYFEQKRQQRRPDFMRAEGFVPPGTVGILEKTVAAMKAKSKAIKVTSLFLKNFKDLLVYFELKSLFITQNKKKVFFAFLQIKN